MKLVRRKLPHPYKKYHNEEDQHAAQIRVFDAAPTTNLILSIYIHIHLLPHLKDFFHIFYVSFLNFVSVITSVSLIYENFFKKAFENFYLRRQPSAAVGIAKTLFDFYFASA